MQCLTYGSENLPRAMFCDNCGADLQVARSERELEAPAATGTMCPQCGAPAVADQVCRGNCGAELAQPPRLEIPGFEILGEIGQGGMSMTYCARRRGDKKLFAIKMVDEELRYILEHEARVLSGLKHPNIIRIHPLEEKSQQFVGQVEWQDRKKYYIILDYLEGGSLTEYIKTYRPLPLKRTIEILEQVSSAVDYAHDQNILHLDLKPSNILLSKDGRQAVVSDFGVALALAERGEDARRLLGTPVYMSPEHRAGREVDARADVYSLGVTLVEMLSPVFPCELPTTTTRLGLVRIDREPEPRKISEEALSRLPDELRVIVLKALSEEKRARYPDAKAFVADLRRAWTHIRRREIVARVVRIGGVGLGIAFLLFDLLYLIQLVTRSLYPRGAALVRSGLDFMASLPFWVKAALGALNAIMVLLVIASYKVEDFDDEVEAIRERVEQLSISDHKLQRLIGQFGIMSLSALVSLYYSSDRLITEIPSAAVLKVIALFHRILGRKKILPPLPIVPSPPPPLAPLPLVPPAVSSRASTEVGPRVLMADVPPLTKLKVVVGGRERVFAIPERGRTIIGRDPQECDIVIEDPEVSRRHAAIEATEEGFFLSDLGSQHGTLVALSGPVTGKHPLSDEDIILIGKSVCFFTWESARAVNYMAEKLQVPAPDLMAVKPLYHLFALNTSPVFADVNLPSKLLVFVWGEQRLFERGLEALRSELEKIGTRIALLILFTDEDEVERTQQMLDITLRRPLAYDVIVLGWSGFYRLTGAENPRSELRRLMFSHIDLITVSPYVITGPVPDTMFFGRERELREIVEHAPISSYALIGGRRIGKTSILHRLHRVRLPSAGFRALYYDCSTTRTCEEFLKAEIVPSYWRPEPPACAPIILSDLIESPPDDRPLVLLLDEVDALVLADKEGNWFLFNALRSLTSGHRCQFVLAGSRILREAMRDPSSPLYNFANEISIGNLDYASVEELVTRPMKQLNIELADEAEVVRRIYAITWGHPNLVQRLCRRLIERLNERQRRCISLEDIEAIVKNTRFLRDDLLDTLWERATPLERIISLLMVQQPECRSFEAVRQALVQIGLRPTAREVKDALERLVMLRSILKTTVEGYDFAATAFPDIVTSATVLSEELAVWREEYLRRGES